MINHSNNKGKSYSFFGEGSRNKKNEVVGKM